MRTMARLVFHRPLPSSSFPGRTARRHSPVQSRSDCLLLLHRKQYIDTFNPERPQSRLASSRLALPCLVLSPHPIHPSVCLSTGILYLLLLFQLKQQKDLPSLIDTNKNKAISPSSSNIIIITHIHRAHERTNTRTIQPNQRTNNRPSLTCRSLLHPRGTRSSKFRLVTETQTVDAPDSRRPPPTLLTCLYLPVLLPLPPWIHQP